MDTETVSSLLTFEPGYLLKEDELIVGLQTDKPLKRAVNPFGGIRMARTACEATAINSVKRWKMNSLIRRPTMMVFSGSTAMI